MKKKTVIIILSVVGGLALLAGLGTHFIISLKADREAMRKQIVDVKDVYNDDIRVILVTVYEDSLPNDYMKYLTGLKDDLRKDWIRTTVKFLRTIDDLNLLDFAYLRNPKKKPRFWIRFIRNLQNGPNTIGSKI